MISLFEVSTLVRSTPDGIEKLVGRHGDQAFGVLMMEPSARETREPNHRNCRRSVGVLSSRRCALRGWSGWSAGVPSADLAVQMGRSASQRRSASAVLCQAVWTFTRALQKAAVEGAGHMRTGLMPCCATNSLAGRPASLRSPPLAIARSRFRHLDPITVAVAAGSRQPSLRMRGVARVRITAAAPSFFLFYFFCLSNNDAEVL